MNTGDHIVLRGVSPGSNPTRPQGGCEIAPRPGPGANLGSLLGCPGPTKRPQCLSF